MSLLGHVRNGVIVLDENATLPENTAVLVIPARAAHEQPAADQTQRLVAEVARIAGLPLEGDQDAFCGADHDRVLYGGP